MDNKSKVYLYIATSLDGYIATPDDGLEWLFKVEGEGDNGYSEFYETIDTIIMGRKTYDWIITNEKGNFPYKDKSCYVFSNTLVGKNENVQFINEDVVSFINKLKNSNSGNIWVEGGGDLLHYFIKERLVDEFIITVAPTIIGKGIPLFKEIDFELELRLKNIRKFNQFAELHYGLK
ncbi:dihydrofolate reductase family protein [Clostridium folliculivorans]|uniref:Dihydrofolate reductase n=1 Tax=Clostridium folliculivorans TaxID=2886038 RepID=A0A9W5Y456_9CLOT|nr:dihydrofolate reductase family protein [Clostridium folliculivorans]GKU26242.1 dihydrofolate reductase [Clostridium folliculivorans]GKU31914.1 dihydrofolate reductase [Clostridium folliculivorans]